MDDKKPRIDTSHLLTLGTQLHRGRLVQPRSCRTSPDIIARMRKLHLPADAPDVFPDPGGIFRRGSCELAEAAG